MLEFRATVQLDAEQATQYTTVARAIERSMALFGLCEPGGRDTIRDGAGATIRDADGTPCGSWSIVDTQGERAMLIHVGDAPMLHLIVSGGAGRIATNLEREDPKTVGDVQYNAALDGIESFLLALACAGVDVSGDAFGEALQTAMEASGNNFDDDRPIPDDSEETLALTGETSTTDVRDADDAGGTTFTFPSIDARDRFIDVAIPVRECTDTPGLYRLSDGRFLGVRELTVTIHPPEGEA
jgi:hypothetical protein